MPNAPTSLLKNMIAALGGSKAIQQLQSLAIEADCTGPGGAFQTWIHSLRPDHTYFRQVSARGTTEIWSTPTQTWTITPNKGVTILEPGVRDFVRGHEFHLLVFEIETRFREHEGAGVESVNGETCDAIKMVDWTGNPASLYIGREDSLPHALELNPTGAAGSVRVFFSDWAVIESLRYFQAFRMLEGHNRAFTYHYRTISPNSVTSALFRTGG